ncbi:uncharacterized protein LOC142844075 [Microtus pennsylvanicus]|uniref:uncharacterized protein LOC142844075 n=1 Tax=Microtus pennsylvanicus TaxID=10058 RepID=UPI003F6AEB22
MLSFASRTKVSSGASRARVICSFWPLFCVVGRWMQDCRNPESRSCGSPAQVTPDSSQLSRARQRSASGGQEVVWQGGGPVCRGHDQGWREHGCSREPPRKGKASHVYQKTPEDLIHRHQPLLELSQVTSEAQGPVSSPGPALDSCRLVPVVNPWLWELHLSYGPPTLQGGFHDCSVPVPWASDWLPVKWDCTPHRFFALHRSKGGSLRDQKQHLPECCLNDAIQAHSTPSVPGSPSYSAVQLPKVRKWCQAGASACSRLPCGE